MCRLVFLGPSLDRETARGILNDAIYLPPLRQADLLTAVHQYQPSAIGIIDGYFLQDLSVWHKEILYALQRGIAVYGSSSMGALRAVEMAPYGMQGIGSVYQSFADGTYMDDDEVALAHAPEELEYAKHSEPMVNIRATLKSALEQQVISTSIHHQAVEAAKATYFPERSLPRLSRVWRQTSLPTEAVDILDEFFQLNYVDVKRQDAIALLHTLAATPLTSPVPRTDLAPPRSISFDTLHHRDRRSATGIDLSKILRLSALHSPDFESLQFQAMNRTLSALFAANLGLQPTADRVQEEARRFRAAQALTGDDTFLGWLRDNDLSEDEFSVLMTERAACHLLQQWWSSVAGQPGLRSKILLDELRLNGLYPATSLAAAKQADLTSDTLTPDFDSWTHGEATPLLRQHAARTGFRIDKPVQQWAREAGFFSYLDMLNDVYLSQAACAYESNHA